MGDTPRSVADFDPYRPPTDDAPPPAPAAGYVSQVGRAAFVGKLLMVFAVVAGINALVDLLDAVTLGGSRGLDTATAEAIDTRQGVVVIAYTICYLATAIPFGRMLAQANRNIAALGWPSQRFSPSSMVWWFFVPILGWIRPQQAVTEAWNACLREPTTLTPPAVSRWWGLWVIGSIIGNISGRIGNDPKTPGELAGAFVFDVVVCLVMIAAALAARTMLRGLATVQDEAAARGGSTPHDHAVAR